MPHAENTPRAALVGVTGFGARHLETLNQLRENGEVRLEAATVINREEAAESCAGLERSGVRIYDDHTAMLEAEKEGIDCVFIPTGIRWHAPMTVAALEAGCHVYVEKPAAGTVAEVDAMIAARDRAGRSVAVGFQDQYHPATRQVKQSLLDGRIGALRRISVLGLWPRPESYYTRNGWAGRLEVEGAVIRDSPAQNALAHFLMAALNYAGPSPDKAAEPVSVGGSLYRAKPIESFDTCSLRIGTDTGVEILFHASHSCATQHAPQLAFHGDSGTATWDIGKGYDFGDGGEPIEAPSGAPLFPVAFRSMLAAVRDGKTPACPLENARCHTRVIETAHTQLTIHDAPADRIRKVTTPKGELRVIDGIEDQLRDCHENGATLGELAAR